MRKLVFIVLTLAFCSPLHAADLLTPSATKELKNTFQSQALLDGETVTGVELGIDLNAVNRLLNSGGDIWVKKTEWNEAWLEDVKMAYSSSSRFSVEGVLRYRTYTKNIFRPSRRWRTASYQIRLKGSVAVHYRNNTLSLEDFKVDLMDMKHFPGWAENIARNHVNNAISAAIPLPFQMRGFSGGDIRLDSLRRDGSVVVAKFLFSDAAKFNVNQLKDRIENAQATLLTGVDFAPRVISANVDLYPDDRGGKSYGLFVEFAEVPGVTRGIELEFRKAAGSWNKVKWHITHDGFGEPQYKGTIFGAVKTKSGTQNIDGFPRIEWRARYNFGEGAAVRLGTQWASGVLEVPDLGIRNPLSGNPKLDDAKIKEFSLVEDPEKGRYFNLRVEKPSWAQYHDVQVFVSLSNHNREGWDRYDIWAEDDPVLGTILGNSYPTEQVQPKKTHYSPWCHSLEFTKNGFERTIVCDQNYGTFVKDGKEVERTEMPPGTYTASVRLAVPIETRGTNYLLFSPRYITQTLVVPERSAQPPRIEKVSASETGLSVNLTADSGDFYEVQYAMPTATRITRGGRSEDVIVWPSGSEWNRQLVKLDKSARLTVPVNRFDIYQKWVVRARTGFDSGHRSPWSTDYFVPVAAALPQIKKVTTTDKGIVLDVNALAGKSYEFQYREEDSRNVPWPSENAKGNHPLIITPAASKVTLPADKIDVYQFHELRMRVVHSSGLRSPWSVGRSSALPLAPLPSMEGAAGSENGMMMNISAKGGDFWEVQYKAPDSRTPWPSEASKDNHIVRVNSISRWGTPVTLPLTDVNVYQKWEMRVRNGHHSGIRSPWSEKTVVSTPFDPPTVGPGIMQSTGLELYIKSKLTPDFYEVEFTSTDKNASWPSESGKGASPLKVKAAKMVVISPKDIEVYRQWQVRVRAGFNNGFRSGWSRPDTISALMYPELTGVKTTANGQVLEFTPHGGDFYEVEFAPPDSRYIKWPSDYAQNDQNIVRMKYAQQTIVPPDKIDIYRQWAVRVRVGFDDNSKSRWSFVRNGYISTQALPNPKTPAKDKPADVKKSADTPGELLVTATNDGTGRPRSGGSSPRVGLNDLVDGDVLHFVPASGDCQKVTVHGRTRYGSWRTLYQGSLQSKKVGDLLNGDRTQFNQLIFSANGAHERYDRRACALEIRKVTAGAAEAAEPAKPAAKSLGVAGNNGTGQRKTGGKSIWIELKTLADPEVLTFKCTSGTCQYMTIHGRTSRGVWQTLYQGGLRPWRIVELLKGRRQQYSHLVISVNGAHERYIPSACEMEISIADQP